jgi:hypothetical protein
VTSKPLRGVTFSFAKEKRAVKNKRRKENDFIIGRFTG